MAELIESLPGIKQQFEELAARLGAKNPRLSSEGSEDVNAEEDYCLDYSLNADDFAGNPGALELCSGKLTGFPGCCGMAILHDARAESDVWFKYIFQLREAVAKASNCGMVQQTHLHNDAKTLRVMRQLRWRTLASNWRNPNSGNHLTVWGKILV